MGFNQKKSIAVRIRCGIVNGIGVLQQFFFFIFVAVKIGNASDEVVEETSVTSSISSDVAQQGYEDGYQAGFQLADMDMQPDAKIAFTTNFGAPSTPEEKEMYNIYKQNYDKGYREGKSAGRE